MSALFALGLAVSFTSCAVVPGNDDALAIEATILRDQLIQDQLNMLRERMASTWLATKAAQRRRPRHGLHTGDGFIVVSGCEH